MESKRLTIKEKNLKKRVQVRQVETVGLTESGAIHWLGWGIGTEPLSQTQAQLIRWESISAIPACTDIHLSNKTTSSSHLSPSHQIPSNPFLISSLPPS